MIHSYRHLRGRLDRVFTELAEDVSCGRVRSSPGECLAVSVVCRQIGLINLARRFERLARESERQST